MTLKIEINKVRIHHTKKKQIEKLNAKLLKVKADRMKLMLKPGKNIKAWTDKLGEMSRDITETKAELKSLYETVDNNKKKIRVYSENPYIFYPESYSDDDGRTKYDKENPVEIKIDETFNTADFSGGIKLKEFKDKALTELRDMRKARKEVGFIEREYSLKGYSQIKTKYKVYLGGGYGSSGVNTYRDVWRGTNHVTELTQNNNLNFIHYEEGTFLKLKEIAKLKECFAEKKPLDNDKHIGIEIEFISKSDRVKIATLLAEKNMQKHVTLVDDGSLRPEGEYRHIHEMKILVKEKDYKEVVKTITECINKAESKVNKLCGLHVHFDMRERSREVVFRNLVNAQGVLFSMNPKNRKEGDGGTCYSKPCTTDDFAVAMGSGGSGRQGRYSGINIQAYDKHKTFEIRIHSGTINAVKINSWIEILLSIVNKSKAYGTSVSTPELLAERFDISPELVTYMKSRIDKFNVKGQHVNVEEVA